MVLRTGMLGLVVAALVGRIVSVEPSAERVVVEAGDERQAVVTPLARALVPGDEVRLSEDERGTWRISTRLPAPRREAVRPVERLPRTNATAPNPSAPEPQNDRAPGDGPGNQIPATSGVPSRH
jgi:hypothetical protein